MSRKSQYIFKEETANEVERFKTALRTEDLNENTVRQNSNYAGIFLEWSALENLQSTEVRYNEIIAFIHYLQQQDYNSRFYQQDIAGSEALLYFFKLR